MQILGKVIVVRVTELSKGAMRALKALGKQKHGCLHLENGKELIAGSL